MKHFNDSRRRGFTSVYFLTIRMRGVHLHEHFDDSTKGGSTCG